MYRGADPTDVMGRRIGAYFIDGLIAVLVTGALGAMLVLSVLVEAPSGTIACPQRGTPSTPGQPAFCTDDGSRVRYIPREDGERVLGQIYLAGAGLSLLVNALLQGITGATPGKAIMGLRVVKANGDNAGILRCVVRTVLLLVDGFFCAVIGMATAFKSTGHRRVGDMVAGTLVIGRKDRDALIMARSGVALPDRTTLHASAWTEGGHSPTSTYATSLTPTIGSEPFGSRLAASDPSTGPTIAPVVASSGDLLPAISFDPGTSAAAPSSVTTIDASPFVAAGPQPGVDAPLWDDERNAFIQYDHDLTAWMQWDDGTATWRRLS